MENYGKSQFSIGMLNNQRVYLVGYAETFEVEVADGYMLAPNPTFAHTQRTHPNNIIYLSSEDQ